MSLPAWCQSALLLAMAATAIAWLAGGFLYYMGTRRIRGLGSVGPLPDSELPSLSIVSAARNEAARIEGAARSLLAQDYPGLQVVAVDDRSEDATGAILDRIAAQESRLRVVHVTELPSGWLGKCHALALGESAASGEWILFTDGDVTLEPDAVRRAVSLAIREGADHVAVAADLEVGGLGEAIFLAYFVYAFNVSQRPWDAKDPRSGAHIGIGAFNLVRREAYERAGGHHRIRMELLDDMGLGLIVKKSGGVSMFSGHDGLVRRRTPSPRCAMTRWSRSGPSRSSLRYPGFPSWVSSRPIRASVPGRSSPGLASSSPTRPRPAWSRHGPGTRSRCRSARPCSGTRFWPRWFRRCGAAGSYGAGPSTRCESFGQAGCGSADGPIGNPLPPFPGLPESSRLKSQAQQRRAKKSPARIKRAGVACRAPRGGSGQTEFADARLTLD
jgi:hypothetical protein